MNNDFGLSQALFNRAYFLENNKNIDYTIF